MLVDLARRGLSHPSAVAYVKRAMNNEGGEAKIEVPVWGIVLLYVSFTVAVVSVSLISYTLNEVITTLCMVESPVAAITVSPSNYEDADKEEKESLLETGPTITLINQKPITSSIRGTIKHLVATGGRLARFRGYGFHMAHSALFGLSSTFFGAALPHVPGQPILVAAISGAAVANIHAAWTHKVVSLPSDTSFYQRIPSMKNWKTLALPAAIASAMPYISIYLTCGVAMLMRFPMMEQGNDIKYTGAQRMSVIIRLILLFVFAVSCSLFLCLPAIVTLVRIEASILAEDEDTIVPFDRTFGGKVVGQMMGGTGKIGFLDAWRSFNWEARRRLIKLFAKIIFTMAALILIIAHVLVAEVFVVMGPALGKFLSQAKAEGWVV